MSKFTRLIKLAEQRVCSMLGVSREMVEVKVQATPCGGCGRGPMVHTNDAKSVEVRCVNSQCPDPRWTTIALASEEEAIHQWNLLNKRPPWTVGSAREGLKGTGSRDGFASHRGVFGEKNN
jgi:hypothetical protein